MLYENMCIEVQGHFLRVDFEKLHYIETGTEKENWTFRVLAVRIYGFERNIKSLLSKRTMEKVNEAINELLTI